MEHKISTIATWFILFMVELSICNLVHFYLLKILLNINLYHSLLQAEETVKEVKKENKKIK